MHKYLLSLQTVGLSVAFILLQAIHFSCNEKNQSEASQPTTNQTASSNTQDALDVKYDLDKIKLPPGFTIKLFAEVPNARSLCFGSNGTVFVGNTGGNKVYAVVDKDKNGRADTVYTIASGLNTPCGVAFKDGSLYVAEIDRILRFDNIENSLQNPPAYKIVYNKLPKDKWHGWKFIAFGPDNKLYVPVGAPCNVCIPDSMHACLTRMNPDGTGFEVYARGIRNTVGFDWNPQTKEIWFTDNGRDELGDNIPSDELNTAPKAGMNFGFPYCHQGDILDPEFGKGKNCSNYTPPRVKLGPHVASLGMRFYTGSMFPAEYKNQIFIAEHGSWNRSKKIGYNITLIKFENNKAQASPFATGWLQADEKVLGRPVDVQVAPDGALLVSDDSKGAVYRITYAK